MRLKIGLTSGMQCLSQPMSMCHGMRLKTGLTSGMQCLSQPISMCHGLRWKTGLTSCMQCLSQPMSMCHGLRWKTCSWTYEGGSICRQGSAILLQIASCTRLSKPFAEASDKIACHLRRATIHGIKNIFFRKNWWGYLSQRDKKTVNGILHDSSAQAIRWNILSANGGSGNITLMRCFSL